MAIDAPTYRQLIGHFATGVTVVTTAVDGLLHGMTANALTSVSLDPLMLLVCVDKSANAHGQLQRASHFAVNMLAEDQEEVSRTFAQTTEPQRDGLQGVPYRLAHHGSPVIEGALAYVECRLADSAPGGDHTVFFGEVVDGDVLREAPPLLFFRGGYRKIAR